MQSGKAVGSPYSRDAMSADRLDAPRPRRRVAGAAALVLLASAATAATPSQRCGQGKNQEAAKYAECRQNAEAKFALTGDAAARTAAFAKCRTKYDAKWPSLEQRAATAGEPCRSVGDQQDVRRVIEAHTEAVATALAGGEVPGPDCEAELTTCLTAPRGQMLETGAFHCWNAAGAEIPCAGTGQDGELQKGLAPLYTSNGDGTLTDRRTGLTWEQHSWGEGQTSYTWPQAYAKIAALNAAVFAGYTDWRLPNLTEILTIVAFGEPNPLMPGFRFGCVPGCDGRACNCVFPDFAWTSTTDVGVAATANFNGGLVTWAPTTPNGQAHLLVRAVRGGF